MSTLTVKLVKRPANASTDHERMTGIMIDKIMNSVLKTAVDLFEETEETWEDAADVAVFIPESVTQAGKTEFRVVLEAGAAEKATLSVWQLLERGTEERPMHVSHSWLSKTAPGQVASMAGDGTKTGIWRPYANGIEARGWIELIGDLVEPEAILEVGKAAEAALDQIFSG